MSVALFDQQLSLGRMGERIVVDYLKQQGWGVIPSYEYSGEDGKKAPRLTLEATSYVLPDIDICRSGKRLWAEVKTYERPYPNRRYGCDVHGIRRRHRDDYLAVSRETGTPVLIVVLEVDSGALLSARLDRLNFWPCQCKPCERDGSPHACEAKTPDQVYWNRGLMRVRTQFPDETMADLRRRWPRDIHSVRGARP